MGANHFHSADAGAPVLSGQAGALVALLDAVLVNGYGSKSPLGWTIAFTATNRRAYRMDSADNSGRYLYVDDTTTTYATVVGYNAMTDIDTGTGRFPTSSGVFWRKSSTANSTARAWDIYGDEAFVHLFSNFHGASNNGPEHVIFGDLLTLGTSLGPVTVLAGARTTDTGLTSGSVPLFASSNTVTTTSVAGAHFVPNHTGSPDAQVFRCTGHLAQGGSFTGAIVDTAYAGAEVIASPLWAYRPVASATWMLGEIPGIQLSWKTTAGTAYDAVHGTTIPNLIGDGHDYRAQKRSYDIGTNNYHYALLDITGPWR